MDVDEPHVEFMEALSWGVVSAFAALNATKVEASTYEFRQIRKLVLAAIDADKIRVDLGCHTRIRLDDGPVVPAPGVLAAEWVAFREARLAH